MGQAEDAPGTAPCESLKRPQKPPAPVESSVLQGPASWVGKAGRRVQPQFAVFLWLRRADSAANTGGLTTTLTTSRAQPESGLLGTWSMLAGLSPQCPSHPFHFDCVGAGGGGQVRGREHLQDPGRVARWALGSLMLAEPVGHQPHEELVGPGYA